MNNENKQANLLSKIEKLIEKIADRSEVDPKVTENYPIEGSDKDLIALRLLKLIHKRIQEGDTKGPLGLSRGLGDWNFERDILSDAHEIEKLYCRQHYRDL